MDAVKTVKSDMLLRKEGVDILLDKLGYVDAERFISLIIREPFDYTRWQKDLFMEMDIEELATIADSYSRKLEK